MDKEIKSISIVSGSIEEPKKQEVPEPPVETTEKEDA
jgi:hypothetical protein